MGPMGLSWPFGVAALHSPGASLGCFPPLDPSKLGKSHLTDPGLTVSSPSDRPRGRGSGLTSQGRKLKLRLAKGLPGVTQPVTVESAPFRLLVTPKRSVSCPRLPHPKSPAFPAGEPHTCVGVCVCVCVWGGQQCMQPASSFSPYLSSS